MSFTRNTFLSGLRFILALEKRRIGIGAVVTDAIEEYIIPALREKYDEAEDGEEREEFDAQIELWEAYADTNDEGDVWNEEAAKVISSQARKFGFGDDASEEVAGEIASNFYQDRKLSSLFQRFNIEDGPRQLVALFKKVVSDEAFNEFKKMYREKSKEVSTQTPVGEEGEGEMEDFIEDVRSGDVEGDEVREVRDELYEWMQNELKSESTKQLFNIWFDITEDKDPSSIKWTRDIMPEWQEAMGHSTSKGHHDTAMRKHKKQMYDKIIEFFEKELAIDIDKRMLKNLKLASAVAKTFWRRKLAAWMLEPVRK